MEDTEKVEAEIESVEFVAPSHEQKVAQEKKHQRLRVAFIFTLGMLIGFAVKTEASRKVTMGYNDYALAEQSSGLYDLNAIQKQVAESGSSVGLASPQSAGGSCGQ